MTHTCMSHVTHAHKASPPSPLPPEMATAYSDGEIWSSQGPPMEPEMDRNSEESNPPKNSWASVWEIHPSPSESTLSKGGGPPAHQSLLSTQAEAMAEAEAEAEADTKAQAIYIYIHTYTHAHIHEYVCV